MGILTDPTADHSGAAAPRLATQSPTRVMRINRHELRAIRERSGLSCSELAHAAGLSQPHVANVENGRRSASPAAIVALAAALRVPLVAIICEPPPETDGHW
jgi:DNA-binding transcriptional regulator YiaG